MAPYYAYCRTDEPNPHASSQRRPSTLWAPRTLMCEHAYLETYCIIDVLLFVISGFFIMNSKPAQQSPCWVNPVLHRQRATRAVREGLQLTVPMINGRAGQRALSQLYPGKKKSSIIKTSSYINLKCHLTKPIDRMFTCALASPDTQT